MEEIQIGPWRVSRPQQLLCLWIAVVTEMSSGSIPNPSQMGRYLKKLPSLKECLVHCDSILASDLSSDIVSLWGPTLAGPLIINTYRSFLSRILLPVDEGLIVSQFAERAMAALDDRAETLLRAIQPYCPLLCRPSWEWTHHCEFGPGAVAECSGQLMPYEKMALMADQLLCNCIQPTSRIILVPKNWKKKRLIAAEPIVLGFLQHGLATELVRAVEQCSPIVFSDQEQNRSRCNMAHATIDLSNASDSVLLTHVRILMPEWLPALESVRSTHARYKDAIYSLQMYGTMGSACTFPVETWIFYSLSYGIMNYMGASQRELKDIRVYGDDIVVPVVWGQVVADFLVSCGFEVNASKSYWDTSVGYRETCGVETFLDTDVSPMRLPRGATEMWLETADPQSYSDFVTRLAYYGCTELQRVLLSSYADLNATRSNRMRGARLGSRSVDDSLPSFTAFCPCEPDVNTNIHISSYEKRKCCFTDDQWDIFCRDYLLTRRRNMNFDSHESIRKTIHDLEIQRFIEAHCIVDAVASSRSRKVFVK